MIPRTLPRLLEVIGMLSVFWLIVTPISFLLFYPIGENFVMAVGVFYLMIMIVMVVIYIIAYLIVAED